MLGYRKEVAAITQGRDEDEWSLKERSGGGMPTKALNLAEKMKRRYAGQQVISKKDNAGSVLFR